MQYVKITPKPHNVAETRSKQQNLIENCKKFGFKQSLPQKLLLLQTPPTHISKQMFITYPLTVCCCFLCQYQDPVSQNTMGSWCRTQLCTMVLFSACEPGPPLLILCMPGIRLWSYFGMCLSCRQHEEVAAWPSLHPKLPSQMEDKVAHAPVHFTASRPVPLLWLGGLFTP